VLLLLAALIALELGLAVGSLAALGGAAGTVALSRLAGSWDATVYIPLILLTLTFGLTAVSAAWARAAVRAMKATNGTEREAPVNGSLGLLAASLAEGRLDEEIDRAEYARSALTVVWMRTRLIEPNLPQPDRGRVLRVASRTIESVLEVVHLPVAFSDADIVCILPVTDEAGAQRLVERIRRACASATLLVGAERNRRRFSQLGTLDVGVAAYPADGASATALLEAARLAVRRTDDALEGPPDAARPAARLPSAARANPGPGVPVMATADDTADERPVLSR
jgi:membrane protein implicated in regulation of membrane protease activity